MKPSYYSELLKKSMYDINFAPKIYRPTKFWQLWMDNFKKDIEDYGFEKFKSAPSCLSMFVSNYGYPFNEVDHELKREFREFGETRNLSQKQLAFLEFYLTGEMNAFSDFRVLKASDNGPACGLDFSKFTEGDVGAPMEQFNFDGRILSRNSLNYLLMMVFLRRIMINFTPRVVLEIGGGWGSLGEILQKSKTESMKYINIDIPPTSCFSNFYLRETFGRNSVMGYMELHECEEISVSKLGDLTVLPSWTLDRIRGKIDLFVNSISFQEMEPKVVRKYLEKVIGLQPRYVMMRNLREGKNTVASDNVGSRVDEAVKREFYVNNLSANGYSLVEDNVVPFGRKTLDGFHSEILIFEQKKS